jgi:hypothetical protein
MLFVGVRAIPHRASLYANDLILFLRPWVQDQEIMKIIFDVFKGASGFGCNLSKYQIAPIRCDAQNMEVTTGFFPCPITEFPLKYLGVRLSLTKQLPRSCLQPLVDKVADYLPFWKGRGMNRSGRLVLTKSTLSVVPIFISNIISLPEMLSRMGMGSTTP